MNRNLVITPAGVRIACLGLVGIIYFLIPFGGDGTAVVVPHFALLRFHLLNEIAIPYFTPLKCAGWLLAAHPKNLLFTTFAPLALLIPNSYTAVKMAHDQLVFVMLLTFFGLAVLTIGQRWRAACRR